jgi:signal transduction histidine kinase
MIDERKAAKEMMAESEKIFEDAQKLHKRLKSNSQLSDEERKDLESVIASMLDSAESMSKRARQMLGSSRDLA